LVNNLVALRTHQVNTNLTAFIRYIKEIKKTLPKQFAAATGVLGSALCRLNSKENLDTITSGQKDMRLVEWITRGFGF
jgi:hypothetical protein